MIQKLGVGRNKEFHVGHFEFGGQQEIQIKIFS